MKLKGTLIWQIWFLIREYRKYSYHKIRQLFKGTNHYDEKNIVGKASKYAVECHASTNHLYNGMPYNNHLLMVVNFGYRFLYLIPQKDRDHVIAGCWVHDVIEDCRQTYNDVAGSTNHAVAELAYALTNEKGKNRKERGNDKYYEGIRNTQHASYVKICDRMANYYYSLKSGSRMAQMYEKEMPDFISKVYDPKYDEMFSYLKKMTRNIEPK